MNYKNLCRKRSPRLSTPVRLGVAAVAACFIAGPALSNPVNPTVDPKTGTASFNQVGNVLTVTNSNGAVIDWKQFNIAAGETTHFAQTSASSSVLNRVLAGGGLSAIYGTLSSNGRVWLVNPAGIMVGPGGQVNVAGFVASTLNISNADFLAGRHLFINDGTAKDVVNQGTITTPAGGSVYLIGSNVSNEGIITTPNGETILAAGQTVSLIDSATPGVKVDITGAEGNATNLGTITAEAGRIGIAGVIVRNSGILNASSVVSEGGRIFLKASKDAVVDGQGRVLATGTKGGSIEVTGNRVAVIDQAQLDASGMSGGGTVLVGGDAHGANPNVLNAQQTVIGSNASIRADATIVGDGGTVIVWADGDTRFYGSISARGGAQSGNGGFVETSGSNLVVGSNARVTTAAPNGRVGTWLLDPNDIDIVSSDPGNASTYTTYLNLVDAFSSGPSYTSIDVSSINGSSSTVTLQANHNINFNTSVLMTIAGAGLTAQAGNNIALNSNSITTNGGTVTLTANDPSGTPSGTGSIVGGGSITTAGGNIMLTGYAVTVGALNTTGIAGTPGRAGTSDGPNNSGGAGSNGGDGGTVTIQANTAITTTSITTTGGVGGVGGDAVGDAGSYYAAMGGAGGTGGKGGDVVLTVANSGGTINTGTIDTSGGQGGVGGNTAGYNIYYNYTQTQSGGIGGTGGQGGTVNMQADTLIATASIITTGGIGGKGGDGSGDPGGYYKSFGGMGGTGGTGGDINLTISSPTATISTGDLDTSGGQGGTGGNTSGYYYSIPYYYNSGGTGGTGGTGGNLNVVGTNGLGGTVVSVGGGTGSINTGGGAGGTGGLFAGSYLGYSGGYASGGNIKLSAQSGDITLNAFPLVFGTLSTRGSIPNAVGGTLQIAASNDILLDANFAIPSAATIGADIQFRAGNNINLMHSGGPHSIITNGQSLTLSANDDLIQPTATFNVDSGAGSIIGGGNITTNGGNLTLSGYGATVGAIGTSGPGGITGNGYVSIIVTGGDITTGSITTSATGSYSSAGYVNLQTVGGKIVVNGDIDARGANGDFTYTSGSSGNSVELIRNGVNAPVGGTAVSVSGNIWTYGGDAFAGSGNYKDGGAGGSVLIGKDVGTALVGNISISGSIDTHGGNAGGGNWGGSGGSGGYVAFLASGSVTSGAISAFGGDTGASGIGNSGYYGGAGGNVTLQGLTVAVNGSIDTHGGRGGDGGEGGCCSGAGQGGAGGDVTIGADNLNFILFNDAAGNPVTTSSVAVHGLIDTHGGDGGTGLVNDGSYGAGNGGDGGMGGAVTLAATGSIGVDNGVLSYGGNGGDGGAVGAIPGYSGGNGGWGGLGGSVNIYGSGIVLGKSASGSILTYGGQGGLGGDGDSTDLGGNGGPGGQGGMIYLKASTSDITVSGLIDTHGGNAGDGGAFGGNGGDNSICCNLQGNGGSVTLSALFGNVSFASILTTGGNGGNGSDGQGFFYGGNGGAGANGGYVSIDGSLSIVGAGGTGTITTSGGNGGNGGLGNSGGSGGAGGSGGSVDINTYVTPLGAVLIGSIDTHGGNGGSAAPADTTWGANNGGLGGPGGYVSIYGTAISTLKDGVGAIITKGGDGGSGGASDWNTGAGGNAGYGEYVYLDASVAGTVITGNIDTRGGMGGNAGVGGVGYTGGDGGLGGTVEVYNASSITTGLITTRGGDGGHGGGYGDCDGLCLTWNYNQYTDNSHQGAGIGGDGGAINLQSSGAVITGAIDASGGNGGSSGLVGGLVNGVQYSLGGGGDGGIAANDYKYGWINDVTINGTSITIGGGMGTILARGGNGGTDNDCCYYGGNGGSGGYVYLTTPSLSGTVVSGGIYTAGGIRGTSPDGPLGLIGSDGSWNITGNTVTLTDNNLDFMPTGSVTANVFEFDPITTASLSITQGAFNPLYYVPTVKFGNGTTTSANLLLTGAIDLTGTSINTLSLNTSGTVSQDSLMQPSPLILPGALTVNAGSDVMLTDTGNVIDGRIDIGTTGAINLTNAATVTTLLGTVSAVGAISVSDANSITLDVVGSISSSATGDAITLESGGTFANNSGSTTPLSVTGINGRWLVYALDPVSVTKNGMTSAFRQYNTSYGGTINTASGNGFIYTSAPGVLSVDTTGTASHTYGNTPAGFGYNLLGFADNEDNATNIGLTGTAVFTPAISSTTAVGSYLVDYFNGLSSTVGYTFILGTGLNYTVNPAVLTYTVLASLQGTAQKQYDGTTNATLVSGNFGLTGFMNGDLASINKNITGTYLTKNVGTGIQVSATLASGDFTFSAGTASNYTLPTIAVGNIGIITQAPLTISAVTDSRQYNGLMNSSLTPTVVGTVFSGDTLSNLTQTFASKNVLGAGGSTLNVANTYTLSDTNGGGNYNVTLLPAAGTITARPLTVTATGVSKVYDGQTTATVIVGDNRVTNDVLTIGSGTASYLDKNVGVGKTVNVSGITLGGSDAVNYTFNTTAATTADITRRPLSTWIGGTTGNWSLASNWDALPDLSNVLAVFVPTGKTVTYDVAAGATNLASVAAAGLSITGGALNIANNLTVSSAFSQAGGTLAFGPGASASITQASGNLVLPAIAVANLSLNAPTGAITQSGAITALTLNTQSQGGTTLTDPTNQITGGRIDMTAGGPLSLWASGDLSLGAINAGANSVVIKAGGAILQAVPDASTNIIAGSADLTSIFGGAAGGLAISANTQVTGALTATVGSAANHGGIRIMNTGAEPASATLIDNALAGASVSFLNTGNIDSTSGITLQTLNGGDLGLFSNGNLTWDSGNLSTPSGSVLVGADGTVTIAGTLSSAVDLALASATAINVNGSVITRGTGTASFVAPSVAINGSVNAADDVGMIAGTINFNDGSRTGAGHDVILVAAADIRATNASVTAGHDISAGAAGDMHINGSSFTAGNDIYITMVGPTSTLYLNDVAGLARSFLWAQAPSTIHLDFPARADGGVVVDGAVVDLSKYKTLAGASGFFYSSEKIAVLGSGLVVTYSGGALNGAPPLLDDLMDRILRPLTPISDVDQLSPQSSLGGTQGFDTGGSDGAFGGSDDTDKDDKDKKNAKDEGTGLKKHEDKAAAKKLGTCSL
jgi:filamentous hemagglutinin family protein